MENKIVEDGLNKNKLERFEFFFTPHHRFLVFRRILFYFFFTFFRFQCFCLLDFFFSQFEAVVQVSKSEQATNENKDCHIR